MIVFEGTALVEQIANKIRTKLLEKIDLKNDKLSEVTSLFLIIDNSYNGYLRFLDMYIQLLFIIYTFLF